VIGKSLLFSRSRFESLGGFTPLEHVLAEDFVMGKMFQHGGYRVKLARGVVENVNAELSFGAFLRRQERWSTLAGAFRPPALLDPLPSPLGAAARRLADVRRLVGRLGAAAVARDLGWWLLLRGWRRAWIPLLLSPLRELCVLCVWARAPFKRHVSWRGQRVRLGMSTVLYQRPASSI
jgi:hypothetical protein